MKVFQENFSDLIRYDRAWLFAPSAILLGALHGLEPGHSKSMMAAFIVAVRGTIRQAVILGLSATASHTAVVWLIALLGLSYGEAWAGQTTEAYLKLLSAVLIMAVSLWVMTRTFRQNKARTGNVHTHSHGNPHSHDHNELDGHHNHSLVPSEQNAHERHHADHLQKALSGKEVTNGQIILFGLTGGLIPCPAAITILLLCLQLKKVSLGLGLVLCFSIGLALTLVTTGVLAAWGTRHAMARWPVLNKIISRAPYFSSVIIIFIGVYIGWQGIVELRIG